MNCDTVAKQLPLMLYGELSFTEEEALQQHLECCGTCRCELISITKLQRGLDRAEVDIEPALLADCRRNLHVATSAIAENGGPRRSFWAAVKSRIAPQGSTWNWFGKPVSALSLIAMGFFGARLVPTAEVGLPLASSDVTPVASRVRFIEPQEAGQVQIVLEETRQRVLSGDMEDDGIRTLLLRAARESSDPGVRVETMDLLKAQPHSDEVRKALLHALQQDANAGVRLKALEALRPSATDPETRYALTQVVLKDENPGVRTQAIDLLTSKHEPSLVGVLQEILARENNTYVRMKCQRALSDMNASVETF
jgi:HEAT repeats/Putative zinc-finger